MAPDWSYTEESRPPNERFGYRTFEQYGITKEEYEHMKSQILIQHLLCEMSPSTSVENLRSIPELNQHLNEGTQKLLGIYFEELPMETRDLFYESYLKYCNKADFTHVCATSATLLYDGWEKQTICPIWMR